MLQRNVIPVVKMGYDSEKPISQNTSTFTKYHQLSISSKVLQVWMKKYSTNYGAMNKQNYL